jgi:hypothetical protein
MDYPGVVPHLCGTITPSSRFQIEQATTLSSLIQRINIDKSLGFSIQTQIKGDMRLLRVGIPRGSLYPSYPKAVSSSFFHNSQLSHPIVVSLSILEPGCGELLFVHHLNHVAFCLYRQEAFLTLEVPCPIPSPHGSLHQT